MVRVTAQTTVNLGRRGIDAQAGQGAATLQLATTAADWAHASGGDWSSYAAEIARTAGEEATRDACPVHD